MRTISTDQQLEAISTKLSEIEKQVIDPAVQCQVELARESLDRVAVTIQAERLIHNGGQTANGDPNETQDEIEELKLLIERLTCPPIVYCTVAAVKQPQMGRSPKKFFPGCKVEAISGKNQGCKGTLENLPNKPNPNEQQDPADVPAGSVEEKVIVIFDDERSDYCKMNELSSLEEDLQGGYVVLAHDGKSIEVSYPKDLQVEAGCIVKTTRDSLQILDLVEINSPGVISLFKQMIDDEFAEIDIDGRSLIVWAGHLGEKPEAGDRVALDPDQKIILRNLGHEQERFRFNEATGICWNDIGGLEIAKQELREAVELPHLHPEIFSKFGKKPIKGILMYGPPGCGKTMLGKATATALGQIYNGRVTLTGFIYVKGPEILDKYVGVAESTIRQIFHRARKHSIEHNYPAVIFIDEADAILGKRGMGISSDMERTIVPMFLAEMDGLSQSGALVILATNRPDVLDPAVVRDGRIDRKIKIGRPDQAATTEIFHLNLGQVLLEEGSNCKLMASFGTTELFSPKRILYKVRLRNNTEVPLTMGHTVSGAKIAVIVDKAISIALRRNLESNAKKIIGLRQGDISDAISDTYRQDLDLDHEDVISEFILDFRSDVTGVEKLRQSMR